MVAMEVASDGEGTKFDIVANGKAKEKNLGLTKKNTHARSVLYMVGDEWWDARGSGGTGRGTGKTRESRERTGDVMRSYRRRPGSAPNPTVVNP